MKKEKIIFIFLFQFLFCFIFSLSLVAQKQHLYFTNYGVKEGLSYGVVNDLFRDSEGFLWVSTFNGLCRFDGTGFQKFYSDRHNYKTIADNNVQEVCEDHNGRIWCATLAGISCYDKTLATFKNYILENPGPSSLLANKVYEILCDRHGKIWAGGWGGLYEYDSLHDKFLGYCYKQDDVKSMAFISMAKKTLTEDPAEDRIWFSGAAGIQYIDTKTKEIFSYRNNPNHLICFENKDTYPLRFDNDGNLWYAHKNIDSLYCFHSSENRLEKIAFITNKPTKKSSTDIALIFFDSQNTMWISDWGANIYFKEPGSSVWQYFSHNEQDASTINSNFFWDMLEDKDGTLWFGALNGIAKYEPGKQFYTLLNPAENLNDVNRYNKIMCLNQQNDSTIWLGTDKGLYEYNFNKNFTISFYENKINPSARYAVKEMVFIDGKLWLGTNNGIKFFDPATKKFYVNNNIPMELLHTHSYVDVIYHCRNGDLWIITSQTLFHYSKSANTWKHYIHDSADLHSVAADITNTCYEDSYGNVWFGSSSSGIFRFNTQKNSFEFFKEYHEGKTTRKFDNVYGIIEAGEGQLFLLSLFAGLTKFNYKNDSAKVWRESDGLATDANSEFIKDNNGNLWLAGYQDVSLLDIKSNTIRRFRMDYASTNYSYYNVVSMLRNGNVCISFLDGIAVFDPLKLQRNPDIHPVLISNFSVFENSIPYTQQNPGVNLNYKQNFFSISFSSFEDLNTPTQYAYKLENYDADWVFSGTRKFASYTNVPPGKYNFLVKAVSEDGKWSSEVTTVHIEITPPFWQTWWFRLLVAAAIIAAAIIIIKLREKRLINAEKLKSEFRERITASEMQALRAQMNPHFLYNSLNAIRLFVLQNDGDNAEKYLVKFAKLMRLILDNSRQEWISLNSELEQLNLYMELEQLRFDNKFDFLIAVDASLKQSSANMPSMILQPYIENAILHGIAHKQGKGSIQLSITKNNHELKCIVEDNGVGRLKAAQLKNKISSHKSIGLKVTEERLQLISLKTGKNANVQVIDHYAEDGTAAGTKVIIHLPFIENRNNNE